MLKDLSFVDSRLSSESLVGEIGLLCGLPKRLARGLLKILARGKKDTCKRKERYLPGICKRQGFVKGRDLQDLLARGRKETCKELAIGKKE